MDFSKRTRGSLSPAELALEQRKRLASRMGVTAYPDAGESRRIQRMAEPVRDHYRSDLTMNQLAVIDMAYKAAAANNGNPAPLSTVAIAAALHVNQATAMGIVDGLVQKGHIIASKATNSALTHYATSIQTTRKSALASTLGVRTKGDINISISVVDGNAPKKTEVTIPAITGTSPAPAQINQADPVEAGKQVRDGFGRVVLPAKKHVAAARSAATNLDAQIGQPLKAPKAPAVAPAQKTYQAMPGTFGSHMQNVRVRTQKIAAPVTMIGGLPADINIEIDPATGKARQKPKA